MTRSGRRLSVWEARNASALNREVIAVMGLSLDHNLNDGVGKVLPPRLDKGISHVGSNGFIESFHGKFRDEVLNPEVFYSLQEAQVIIEQWRQVYNTVRPHSTLGYQPPAPEAILAPVLAQPMRVVETSITT